ncbi:hypothetical protein H5410_052152 [Solanum commersonii]|uniref:Uncharacterized protein n=1 Tax=Solanum commersonii TaxID=4109 RepID=A0A9J5X266_SOLCO|nr:hypothetical protein H5410_052152 [Solanum commersonii]
MGRVNLDRPKWLPENWNFEIKGKFRSKNEVDIFLKTGGKHKKDSISSIPSIIVASDDFCNDGIPLDLLLLSQTCIDVELDVRVETTILNKGDVFNKGKMSYIGRSGCQRIGVLKQKFVALEPLQEILIDIILNQCSKLLPSGTYIDVELDVRVDTTTPNKCDVSIEGKVSDVTPSKLQIQRKITPIRQVNLDKPKWLLENWRFETNVQTTRANTRIFDRYYIEHMFGGNCRSKNEVDYFMKIGDNHKKAKSIINYDAATPSEEKSNRRREA